MKHLIVAKYILSMTLAGTICTTASGQAATGNLQFGPTGTEFMYQQESSNGTFNDTRTITPIFNTKTSTVWWCLVRWSFSWKEKKVTFNPNGTGCRPKTFAGPTESTTQPVLPGRHLFRTYIAPNPPSHGMHFYVWLSESLKPNEFHYCASTLDDTACTTIVLPPL